MTWLVNAEIWVSGDTGSVSALNYAQQNCATTEVTLHEPANCAKSRLSDLNKGWINQVLSVLNRLRLVGIYNESVFIFFLRALWAEILRHKISEIFKKRRRRRRRYGVRETSFWNFWRKRQMWRWCMVTLHMSVFCDWWWTSVHFWNWTMFQDALNWYNINDVSFYNQG